MARIRTIKPGFFRHVELFDAERASGLPLRVAFAGLWTVADRAGRFKWEPRGLKLDCLPHDQLDFAQVLDALAAHGFIVRYEVAGKPYGVIPTFAEHQHFNVKEGASALPAPNEHGARTVPAPSQNGAGIAPTRQEQEQEKEQEGEGKRSRAGARSAAKGSRWPADAIVPDDWISEAMFARGEHDLPAIDLRLEAAQFQNYWAAKSGAGATKVDWKKTWINWSLKADGKRKSAGGDFFGRLADRLAKAQD